MIFETHVHLDDKRYKDDIEEVIKNSRSAGVSKMVNISADMKSARNSVMLTKKYDDIYATVGVHPHDVKDMTYDSLEELKELCKNDKVVAIGEIGLDYYYEYSDKESQKKWFIEQLKLANELNLPVVIHSRDADLECYEIIKNNCPQKAVIHCFSGSKELAKQYIDMGFYIGIGGVITFKNARKLVEVVQNIPLERILLETDAPYLTPEPFRGQRNSPEFLPFIVNKVSDIKNILPKEVEETTYLNALSFYNIK